MLRRLLACTAASLALALAPVAGHAASRSGPLIGLQDDAMLS